MNTSKVLTAVAKGVGYTVFFVVCTALFVRMTFPTEEARQFAEVQASSALKMKVGIGQLDLLGLGGLELQDVSLRLQPIEEKHPDGTPDLEKTKKQKPRIVQAERLAADLSILPLLFDGRREVAFEGEVQGGEIRDARFVQAEGEAPRLTIGKMAGIRLGPAQLLRGAIGYDLRGTLNGTLDLVLGKKPEDLRGAIDIALTHATIVAPTVPTKEFGPIQLSDIKLGELQLKLKADKLSAFQTGSKRPRGRQTDQVVIYFEDVGASGEDVEVQFDETSVIKVVEGAPWSAAQVDIHFAVHLKDSWFDKEVTAEDGSTSNPNKILKMAMKQNPRLRAATVDGVIGIYCKGTLGGLGKPDACGIERPRIRGGFKKRQPKFGAGAPADAPDKAEPEHTDEPSEADAQPSVDEEPEPEAATRPARAARARAAVPPVRAQSERAARPAPMDRRPAGDAARPVPMRTRQGMRPLDPTPIPAPTPGDTAYEPPLPAEPPPLEEPEDPEHLPDEQLGEPPPAEELPEEGGEAIDEGHADEYIEEGQGE